MRKMQKQHVIYLYIRHNEANKKSSLDTNNVRQSSYSVGDKAVCRRALPPHASIIFGR